MSQKRKNKKGFWSSFFGNEKDDSGDLIDILEGKEPRRMYADRGGLMEAPSGQRFFIFEGPSFKCVRDLRYYLESMTERQIRHHVVEGRNDFAAWVGEVLKQDELAFDLGRSKSRREMLEVLDNFLSQR